MTNICRFKPHSFAVRTLNGFTTDDNQVDTASSVSRPQDSKPVVKSSRKSIEPLCNCDDPLVLSTCSKSFKCQYRVDQVPVYIKTHGCQMNINDTSIIASILQEYGYKIVPDDSAAHIHLIVTCAIRESSEDKIWAKLRDLQVKKANKTHPLKQIGLLGCMAERLKEKVLSTSGSVDIVAGPDAYRDLPRLFAVNKLTKEKAINCLLSFDETYSDIRPVTNVDEVTSFLSITRGCDNLCSYCIVPFTRGKERSRSIETILDELKTLIGRGIKEVTLLGQNVNSYRDLMTSPDKLGRADLMDRVSEKEKFASGFKTVYKPRTRGITFDVLLEEVAKLSPELRVRFTSPHPKDFTDEVIEVMSRYPNIAKCVHLPAQSGSNTILEKMRRGYTKQSYLNLVDRMRAAIPNLALTSDMISGFCGETQDDHEETMDLIRRVRYNYIYAFPYSMRDKTHAYHRFVDDVDEEAKRRRVGEILELFRIQATEINKQLVGTRQLVLVEKTSRRSEDDWLGRVDTNVKTILPKCSVINGIDGSQVAVKPGDYVECLITETNSQTLRGKPLQITTLTEFYGRELNCRGTQTRSIKIN